MTSLGMVLATIAAARFRARRLHVAGKLAIPVAANIQAEWRT